MARSFSPSTALLLLVIVLISIRCSDQLQSSQADTLLRIQQLLGFPDILSSWTNSTDFCSTEPTPSVTLVCYEDGVTQLHIIGNKGAPLSPLPHDFSIDSLVTTLVKLQNLKVLTLPELGLWGPLPGKIARLGSLEILNMSSNFFSGAIPHEMSSLKNLQSLILDGNMFTGQFPDWLGSFPVLSVLNLKNNSLTGSLPNSLGRLVSLRVLTLSHNRLVGEVPDLSDLTNLQVLDLEDNILGSSFPRLGKSLVTLVLRRNRFASPIPDDLGSCDQLQRLDISYNRFVGPFPTSLLSLPAIVYLSIGGNQFTGMLFENLACNFGLKYVDLSSNLLSGRLPHCLLSDSRNRVVLYAGNCISSNEQMQHPPSSCLNAAFAVGIFPHQTKRPNRSSNAAIALGTSGGILGGIALVGLLFLVVQRVHARRTKKSPPTRLISNTASTGYSSKLLSDARYVSQAIKMGTIGLPAYRMFSLEELKEATSNFDVSAFMGEGSHGQMYRGQLKNGFIVSVRCQKMKRMHGTLPMQCIELISKLRHRHLVSALGHCFESLDETATRVFLVFEFIPNVTLRAWISEGCGREVLTWPQRIAAVAGVAKGIQFLHAGMVPGIFSNDLKITDVLLDHNLVPKISSYNLPLLTERFGKVTSQASHGIYSVGSKEHAVISRGGNEDKVDIYDFGVILLEIIMGRPFRSRQGVNAARDELQGASLKDDAAALRGIVDVAIRMGSSYRSLTTVIEICNRCLQEDLEARPSIDDVLWNLQFAAQVQESCVGDSQSHSRWTSPMSPPDDLARSRPTSPPIVTGD